MSTLDSDNPTLLDLANVTDPDGNIATVAEVLTEVNEILLDMTWKEGNLVTGHQTSIRTGIPTPTWRKMYGGVQPTKSTSVRVTDTCGMLEDYAEVDKALADLNGNTAEFRLSEDRPHIEGMSQEMADTLVFGNESTEPEAFTGFAPRFNDLSAENADNIIDAGGTGSDNTSIWLIGWGSETCFGIVPKGSKAGLQFEDKGQVTDENIDGNNGRAEIYRSHYRWDAGLCLKDWRYVVRICNIDKSLLSTTYTSGAFSSGADLSELMFQALDLIPNLQACRPAFYMARDTRTKLRQQLSAKTQGSTLTIENVGGVRTQFFQEVAVRRTDVLAADEARVV